MIGSALNTSSKERIPSSEGVIDRTDVDWSLKYFIIFLIAGGLSGAWVSLLLRSFAADPSIPSLFWLGISWCLLLTVIVLQSLFIKSFTLFLWVALAEAAGVLAFWYQSLSSWVVFGILAFVAMLLIGFSHGRRDLTDNLTIHFGRFSKLIGTAAATGAALFLALFFTGQYRNDGISYPGFRFIAQMSDPVMARIVPGYRLDMSLSDFYLSFAKQQLKGNAQVVLLSQEQQQEVYRQVGAQLETKVAEATAVSSLPEETFAQYFYRVTSHYVETLETNGSNTLIAGVIAVVLYSIIRALMFFFKYIVLIASYAMFKILEALHVFYIEREPRTKEIIMLK